MLLAPGGQMDAPQRPDGAPESHDLLAPLRRGEGLGEARAHLGPELPELARDGRVAPQVALGHPHGADRHGRRGGHVSLAKPRQLEAAAAQVGDQSVLQVKARLHGEGAEKGLLAPAEDPDLHAVPAPERPQEALAVRGVPHGGRRDRDDPRIPVAAGASEELVHRGDGPRDRIGLEHPGAAGSKPRLNPLLLEHLEPHAGTEARHQEADRVRAQLHEGDQITGHGLRCYPAGVAGTTPARREHRPRVRRPARRLPLRFRDADIHRVVHRRRNVGMA